VVKAQLQQQQRSRDVADAVVLAQKSRLDLGVLLFPDPRAPYTLTTATAPPPLPARADVDAAASRHNPELRSALASLRQSGLDVTAARAAYLPDLALNFSYGIDALQFATRGPDGTRNLGYSATATLDIPVWDWFSTQHRVKQSQILRDAARVTLTSTQRRLIAQIDEFYAEAVTARSQLESLNLSVRTAAESLRLTRLRYTAGEATVLEIVDAENSLTLAELAREDGTVRYQVSLANLQILTGTI
jgi:outer membrane protein TolC